MMRFSSIASKIVCGLVICSGLMGCSTDRSNKLSSPLEKWMQENGKPKILSTTAMIDDLVGQIGGDKVDHLALIMGEINPHSYELVKGDDEKISFADCIFYNGLGLEHGASLRYNLKNHPFSVALGDWIKDRWPELILIENNEVDPHIWTDISLWMLAIEPIVCAFSELDPDNQAFYRNNGDNLRKRMAEVDEKLYLGLQKVPSEKRFLVTSHDAFNYFTRRYLAAPDEKTKAQWQKRFDAPEGLAPEGQLSSADIQNIVDHLIFYHIEVVFPESNVSKDSLKKIVSVAKAKGLDVRISNEVLYGDAMGPRGSDAGTYLEMMEHNEDVLIKEWEKEQ